MNLQEIKLAIGGRKYVGKIKEEESCNINLHDKNIVNLLWIRHYHEYKDISFFLTNDYNWEIVKDSAGVSCLIPTKIKR